MSTKKYTVLKDTREQYGWNFPVSNYCLGTKDVKLDTGDYTLEGYEKLFVIERKFNTAEICQNIVQDRFHRELDRLEKFEYPFLVCEFTLADILTFPANSGIPRDKWSGLKISAQFILKRINEYQINYKTKMVFAGVHSMEYVSSLFKRVTELVNV